MRWKKYFGPSTLVTAAFIGPGTLTVCSVSGAGYGYALLWVLLFATLATIVLQEMAARMGLVSQNGLGEAIRSQITRPMARSLAIGLVFAAIIIGNAAYEAGNITGAVLGISALWGPSRFWVLVIGCIAFFILYKGKPKFIESTLVFLVILMSVVFVITAVLVKPDLGAVFRGLFIPGISSHNQLAVLALIGTTIVPYNLFLHASTISQKWKSKEDIPSMRAENAVSISLGGLISMAIVIASAATIYGKEINGINEMAVQLRPLLGDWAHYFLALGLFAAGISSAITAPLAAAYTARGIFAWQENLKGTRFRAVWMFILGVGTLFSMLDYQPIELIKIAQVANGMLLPVIVFFLIYLCNKRSLLREHTNTTTQNILAVLVILVCLAVSLRGLAAVFGIV